MSCSLMRWSRGKLRVLISALVRENEQEGDLGQIIIGIMVITIIITRSYAALRAADLDWIVGPGYSLGG